MTKEELKDIMRSDPEMKWESDPLTVQGRIEGLEYTCTALFSLISHFAPDKSRVMMFADALEDLGKELGAKPGVDSRIAKAAMKTISNVTKVIRSAK